ncbi:hypothetical protein Hypma_008264 [Hypsizygus marmoreus]|uniref:Uncharacterized protein n=1 Tax=Hypsizygus marmoreus TaxID=39966 RepID=A0A369JQU0_HYPMA|nr:hypothetical protein Hypma_008264 [Hypsizygus marmoreus]
MAKSFETPLETPQLQHAPNMIKTTIFFLVVTTRSDSLPPSCVRTVSIPRRILFSCIYFALSAVNIVVKDSCTHTGGKN